MYRTENCLVDEVPLSYIIFMQIQRLLLLVGLFGCSSPSLTAPDTSSQPTNGDELEAQESWAEMDRAARLVFMQDVVMPEMGAMFFEFDSDRFADASCALCHGRDMEVVDYRMPNGVTPLDPAEIPAMFESDDRMAEFMTERVWPRMTELLSALPYDPQTHQGFGCLGCHEDGS